MLLHFTAGRQALWTLLPRYRFKFWRSILSIPAILLPSTSGLKSCSAPRLPRFRLHGPPRRAGWRDWSTACRDVIALIRQVNGERSPIGIKFKPIPATSTNIIQAWQFWLPLLLPRVPLPSSPPCDWRKWSCSWSYNILRVDTGYWMLNRCTLSMWPRKPVNEENGRPNTIIENLSLALAEHDNLMQ